MLTKLRDLYSQFIRMFPSFEFVIDKYGPFDKNTLKLDTKDKKCYVFTYNSEKDWAFRTMRYYMQEERGTEKAR